MIDVVIIHPNSGEELYQQLANEHTAIEPPLWARLIAGYARDQGFTIDLIDAEALNWSAEIVAERVTEIAPLLVVIIVFGHQPSASTQMMPGAKKIMQALNEKAGQKLLALPIIIVGGHISALPEQALIESDAHYACKGEGPITVVELLKALKSDSNLEENSDLSMLNLYLEKVPGLIWYDLASSGREFVIKVNSPAELIDINTLRGDVWDLLPMQNYRAHNWQCFGNLESRQPYASIFTSLSCPFRCSFCCIHSPFGSNSYRMRDPVLVVQEIDHLYKSYGIKTFKIIDEMFVLNEKHITAICEGLIALGYAHELNFWAYARVDTIKPHLLKLMRRAGIRWLALGIESGSKEVLDNARKALKSNTIYDIVQQIKDAGINVIGNYIFGLPGETHETMQQTLELAIDLNCEFANFYSSMAYPGSPMYAEAVKQNKQLPAEWSGYSQHSYDCLPLATEFLSSEDILRFRDKAFHAYFSNPRYLDMIEHKFGIETRQHIEGMTKHRLKRRILESVPHLYQFVSSFEDDDFCVALSPGDLIRRIKSSQIRTLDGHIKYFYDGSIDEALAELQKLRPYDLGIKYFYHRPLSEITPAMLEAL